jgi:hypothetical protein
MGNTTDYIDNLALNPAYEPMDRLFALLGIMRREKEPSEKSWSKALELAEQVHTIIGEPLLMLDKAG